MSTHILRSPSLHRYQNEVGDFTCVCCNEAVRAHPEWWVRDDYGNPVVFGTGDCSIDPATKQPAQACAPYVNYSLPTVREWWYQQPLREVCGPDASSLVDGVMMDGVQNSNPSGRSGNLSKPRYDEVFAGKMQMLSKASEMYRNLNGGEVWGNPLMGSTHINHWGPRRPTDLPEDSYNLTLQHYDGAFDEIFGALNTLQNEWGECINATWGKYHNVTCSGEWDVGMMRDSFYSIRNATMIDKKSFMLHAIPGPAGSPLGEVNGSAATHPSPPHGGQSGSVLSFGWWGPKPAPWQWMQAPEYKPVDVVNAMKQASADMLVQSLAPFLILAEETSFFGYGWFYDIESGYAPCDDNRTLCLAPDGWYPEYSKPLGPPKGTIIRFFGRGECSSPILPPWNPDLPADDPYA